MRRMMCMAAWLPAYIVAAGLGSAADRPDWHDEQWTVEDFTGALGGGPSSGPAVESGGAVNALCGDKAGNLYLLSGERIDIVTPDGVRRPLAGAGTGYRDGLASQALFDQGGAYNIARSLQCDEKGNVYTAENGNHRVRRIFKGKDGKWHVDTVAGGGRRRLKTGESCSPTEADLGNNIAVVAAADGKLTIGSQYGGLYRVSADHQKLTKLADWPEGSGGRPCLVMSDGDRMGNAYFIYRTSPGDGVVRVSADNKVEHIGGLSDVDMKKQKQGARKPHHLGDGPPRSAYLDTPTSIAASPDGSCVYSCGGDEYDIRRIPTDLKTTTATLLCNGRWYVMPVHPNRNRGKSVLNPALTGKSGAEGGPLGNLANCHICGRDYEGNLYGYLYSWVGATQVTADKGPLRTHIYRIRRSK